MISFVELPPTEPFCRNYHRSINHMGGLWLLISF
nr:MAG TPA_asm: hypothetical protein [Caudoviricetes sp.]